MKKEYIVIIILLLGPFLDVSSFLGLPFSLLVRGIFLSGMIFYLLYQKKEWKLLIPLLIFAIIILGYQYLYLHFGLLKALSAIFKFLYLPVAILFFKHFYFPVTKSKVLLIILVTYISIYLLSYVFQIGADAYLETDGKSGFKGLFSSINEFSAIIVCLLPIVTTYLKKNKKYFWLVALLIAALLCSLFIGTKILMGGVLFSILYLLWQERNFLFWQRPKKIKIGILISLVVIALVGCFLFTKTRTYQNMMVQQEFFQVKNVFSFDFVNRVIYNDRLTFLMDNFDYFKEQNFMKILLGIGIEDYHIKMVEIDIFDIIFRYGVIGILVFIGIIGISLEWKKLQETDKISMLLLVIISLTSGHVLIYPATSIYFAIACAKEKT